ncbi:MAG: divalent-cation tolerance protein CutA [Cephaloticoccus sp.]|nr:divalent-cation tolerance protein CutA [Cephaloticoccus sp.]MCF7759411.1 divalent-cation tolerance protein CutA [Cephaloticoccus sp.]
MLIAFTTVAERSDADLLATKAIGHHLAVCVQIDGPITSIYPWQGKIERSEEFRVMFKLMPGQAAHLESLIMSLHPYETPEWIVLPVEAVGEKYLSWALANSISSPL